MTEIIFAGFGGQGVLTAGLIMINAAAREGKQVTWTSSYGSEMRGGTASCSVVISDEEIGSPYPTEMDMLIVMNEPSYDKFIEKVRKGGCVVVDSSLVKGKQYPKDLTVYQVEATSIANGMGNPRGANLAMLGAFMKASGIIEKDFFGEQLEKFFADKGKNNPKNIACYLAGYENAQRQ